MVDGLKHRFHVSRQLGVELDELIGSRMQETDRLGMEGLPIDQLEEVRGLPGFDACQPALGRAATAVGRIPEDRMPDVGKMDPDLMRTPGPESESQKAEKPEFFDHLVVRHRMFPIGHHGHLFPVPLASSQRSFDGSLTILEATPHHGPIFTVNGSCGELCCQGMVHLVGFCDHHQSGRVFVEAVDDSGTEIGIDRRQRLHVMEQRVDERSGIICISRTC